VPGTSARVCHLALENLLIELFQFGDCAPKPQDPARPVIDHGITHICLAVTGLDEEYARLSAAGMRFHSPPTDVGVPGVRTVYGRDPFGNVIELEEALGRVQPEAPVTG
jgi:catechol 2,3-dioxygenase-like lactoylglutathione lyase family enzyme